MLLHPRFSRYWPWPRSDPLLLGLVIPGSQVYQEKDVSVFTLLMSPVDPLGQESSDYCRQNTTSGFWCHSFGGTPLLANASACLYSWTPMCPAPIRDWLNSCQQAGSGMLMRHQYFMVPCLFPRTQWCLASVWYCVQWSTQQRRL